MIRTNALTHASLMGALSAEERAGRSPSRLAVGGARLERAAQHILAPDAGGRDRLRSMVANVEIDQELPEDGWQLREDGE